MNYFRFALEDQDGEPEGFRRKLPDASIVALRDLLDAVRRFESSADGEHAASLRITQAMELLWGRKVKNEILGISDSDKKRRPTGEVKVVDPDVATMSLADRQALRRSKIEHAKAAKIADWATGRAGKPD